MKRFLRKAALWLARIAAVLVILLILFYPEEDWRGARDWAACQRDLAAKGESLDLRQLVPPGKPEDDLSKIPLFTKNYRENRAHYIGLIMKIPPPRQLSHLDIYLGNESADKFPQSSNYPEGQTTDLAVWQKFYRSLPESHLPPKVGTPAEDVLQTFSQFDSQLNEIEEAVTKPNAFWAIDYKMPFMAKVEGQAYMPYLAQVLTLKGVAHLENQEIGSAEKDYLFSLNLSRPLTKGCFFLNYLSITAVLSNANAILWEGLHRHAWNDAQLHEMESALDSIDMLALATNSFRVERAATLQMMNILESPDPEFLRMPEVQSDQYMTVLFRLSLFRPAGWWDQDRRYSSLEAQKGIEGINVAQGTMSFSSFTPDDVATKTLWRAIYIPIYALNGHQFESGLHIAKAETYRRLARLACRLEEYRIAHKEYPEKLDDLPDLPAHLNQEVLSEQPLRYQRKGEGYLLYSLGWNQKDDGGVNFLPQPTPNNNVPQEADWVWPSP